MIQKSAANTSIPSENAFDPQRAGVVDGLRAIAILLIGWYHIWQQSWLMPFIDLRSIGLFRISLDVLPRTGYLWVDLMLFISAFCLFLPHARAKIAGEELPSFRRFYAKRAIRILPLYLVSVFALFIYAIVTDKYSTASAAIKELICNLTFTQTFFVQTYLNAQINCVLWTVAVEMQFYLLFPFIAKCFRKKPLLTFLCMVAVSEAYLRLYALPDPDGLRMTFNQLPAFFGIYAFGMLAALIYELIAHRLKHSVPLSLCSIGSAACCVYTLRMLLYRAAGAQPVQVFQAQYRIVLAALFFILTLSLCCLPRRLGCIFSNPVTRWFAGISYPFYIWHQRLAVLLKEWHIPYWEGETLPNMAGNVQWQHRYTLLCFAGAIAIAVLMTYLIDRPVTKRLRNKITKYGSTEVN